MKFQSHVTYDACPTSSAVTCLVIMPCDCHVTSPGDVVETDINFDDENTTYCLVPDACLLLTVTPWITREPNHELIIKTHIHTKYELFVKTHTRTPR